MSQLSGAFLTIDRQVFQLVPKLCPSQVCCCRPCLCKAKEQKAGGAEGKTNLFPPAFHRTERVGNGDEVMNKKSVVKEEHSVKTYLQNLQLCYRKVGFFLSGF